MSKPITAIFPIENGKLITPLDCNNLQMLNLDTDNLGLGGGNGGNDTGTTTAILKGDGSHGFADAIPDTDYATITFVGTAVAPLESTASHAADVATIDAALATLTTDVAAKADSAAMTTALNLKADEADLQAYITSNDIAVTANTGDITTLTGSLAAKADITYVDTGLATKEPTLPTTPNNNYVLARHNSGAGSAWFFVDPVTLGTTSVTLTDGESFTNTNFDSVSAVFVADDVGLTITGTNIPAGTTISSRTSATRVVLSQATTGTGSGLTFTIVNRLIPAGNTGTVTNFSTVNNNTALFTTAVTNPTSTPELTITPTSVIGNSFYGNSSGFSAAPAFMTAPNARTNLGGTTVGQNLFTLTNPTAISYPRISATNTVSAITPAGLLTEIGAENALTFSSPLARALNVVSMPAATDLVAGHLTASDHTAFNAKVSPARSISTTSPLTGGGDLSANRTLAIPAATASINGYLSSTDFATFTAKPPNTRTIGTTAPLTGGGDLSANRTIAMPAATPAVDGYLSATDFAKFNTGSAVTLLAGTGGTLTVPTVTPPVNRILLNAVLTSPLTIFLPPAAGYGSAAGFTGIELVDIVGSASAGFTVTVSRNGTVTTDTINGSNSIDLPRTISYQRFNSNGVGKWFSTVYYTSSVKSPIDPLRSFSFDAGLQPQNVQGIVTAAAGNSVTVVASDSTDPAFVQNINANGSVTKLRIRPTDLLPTDHPIGTAGTGISESTHIVTPNDGTVDTVRIVGNMVSNLTVVWPDAGLYSLDEHVDIIDVSGTVSPTLPVNIIAANGTDTFNGISGFVFDEAFGRRTLISNGVTGAGGGWSVSVPKTSVSPFVTLTSSSGIFTLISNQNVGTQKARLNLASGVNTLSVFQPYDGMPIELVVFQPSSGAAGTLILPLGSRSANAAGTGGSGLVTLSSTNNALDRLRAIYVGSLSAFLWDPPMLKYSSAAIPAAPSALTVGTVTSVSIAMSWTSNSAGAESGFEVWRAVGAGTFALLLPRNAPTVVTYTDNTVSPSTTYSYKVLAFSTGGSSSFSNTITQATSTGAQTAELLEWHFNDSQTGTAVASTGAGPAGTMQHVAWSVGASGSGGSFAPVAGMNSPVGGGVTNVGVAGAVTYIYKVAAWRNGTPSTHNSAASLTTTTGNAILTTGNYNHITWSAVTPTPDYYEIYRTSATGGNPSTLGRIGTITNVGGTLALDDIGLAKDINVPAGISQSTDAYLVTANSTVAYGVNVLSVSFWLKHTFAAALTADALNHGNNSWRIQATNTGNLSCTFNGTTGTITGTIAAAANSLNDGNWHNIVVLMNNSTSGNVTTGPLSGQTVQMFVGGVQKTVTFTGTQTRVGPFSWIPGLTVAGSDNFVGFIDDVRIYNRIITGAEITALALGAA